jgi:beta-lactamase class A
MILLLITFIFFISENNLMSQNTGALKGQIIKKLQQEQGDFAVAFKTIGENPCSLLINENEIFHAASTMKTPAMIEAFNQENEGILSLSDSIFVKNKFKSIVDGSAFQLEIGRDSGEKLYDFIGDKKPLSSLVYDMIIHSSNLATNLVVEILGAKNITQTMRTLGAANINILRGVEDMKAYEAGLSNTTTARDMLVIYEKIATGRAVSGQASEAMVKILLDQKHNSIIPAMLPDDVKVAHKTGSISGVRHDSGIIILPDGQKYILVLLSKNLENPQKSIAAMAEISQLIYMFVNQNH